ncbi:hypothetical protein V8F33_007608 [Rhypophila sp. PSN 637]
MSSPPPEDTPPQVITENNVKTFGSLLDIPKTSLVDLAIEIRARSRLLNTKSESGRLIRRIIGSRNLVHIIELNDGFKLIIRVPATDKDGLTQVAAKAMASQEAILRLISVGTTMPVPVVYEFGTTKDNTIGAPYICMRFLPGRKVSEVWLDTSLQTPLLEDRRLRILTSVAKSMAQLKQYNPPMIGSFHLSKNWDRMTYESCYDYEEQEDGSTSIIESGGTFDTIKGYVNHYLRWPMVKITEDKSPEARAAILVTKWALKHLHFHLHEQRPSENFMFGLAPRGFDSQNIMVDDQGNLTGILDWDLVQTLPRCVGHIRYPGWITRDWNRLTSDSENWPDELEREELERYRRHYNQVLVDALNECAQRLET